MTIYYCTKYNCEIERVNGNEGRDPSGELHPCFKRSKGHNSICSSLIFLPDNATVGKTGVLISNRERTAEEGISDA